MYYNEKAKKDDQVWVTLDSGETYKFESNEEAAKFLGNIVAYNPYDYAAISRLAEVSVALNQEAENEIYNRNLKIDQYLEARRVLNNACMINDAAIHALCYGLIVAGGLEISKQLFEHFSVDMLKKYAKFCIEKAEKETEPDKKNMLYREAARTDLRAAAKGRDEIVAEIKRTHPEYSEAELQKAANKAMCNDPARVDALKEAFEIARKAGDWKDAWKAVKQMPKDIGKQYIALIKQAEDKTNGGKKLSKEERAEQNRKNREANQKRKEELRKKAEQAEKDKQNGKDQAEKDKQAEQNKKQQKQNKPKKISLKEFRSELQDEYLKKLTADELKESRERAEQEKDKAKNKSNKEVARVKVQKIEAERKEQSSLRSIAQSRYKNKTTFEMRMAKTSSVSSANSGTLINETEKVLQTGGDFKNAAKTLKGKYALNRVSAGQSGAIARAADGVESNLKAQENRVKVNAINEKKCAEIVETRVRITIAELINETGIKGKIGKDDIKLPCDKHVERFSRTAEAQKS